MSNTEAELFTIRCGINQAISIPHIKHIVVITNSLYAAKKIFNSSLHPYQIHSAAITHELREFFNKYTINHIKFWDCPSKENWQLHSVVDKDARSFALVYFLCKSSWNFSKKHFCDNIVLQWKTLFQTSDLKERNFLKLLDSDSQPLVPLNIRGGSWLQHFGHSNLLCTRATRAIINHAPIGEYRLRFFPKENFSCPCGLYPIKSRRHILYDCRRFNNYWNPRRDSIGHFTLFLEFNSRAFSFEEDFIILSISTPL